MERRELGDFLRSRRERLSPTAAGMTVTAARRTPGLRREEVAVLAGVGVSWLTRIEQGRAGSVSAEVLRALADALRLSPAERDHLHHLAGVHLPRPDIAADLDPSHRRLVDGLAPNPAYLLDPNWDVAAWNEPEAELFPLLRSAGGRPNLLRLFLEHPDLRATIADWEDEVIRLVRQFRAHTTAFPSPELDRLVEELQAEYPRFVAAWDRRDVEPLAPHSRRIEHADGDRTYDQHRLPLPDHPGWLLVLFVRTDR
ncbi:MAG: helix-turn-helix transcriptional regulator [Actinomycetota bacterium]